ncbi:MAG TPA: ATP--dephospho-CoA triphosphoribosyl transferase CitG [Nitrososphaeria archaeon]|nr:ATP--dephospho-CoA triphosphoribosyl transferase CitG [Nitrososphaeria archaeon]
MKFKEIADNIMLAGQIAAALEVSGYPKPGNVHRMSDQRESRFEHFIVGSISIGPSLRKAAYRGALAALHKINLSEIGLGSLILEAARSVKSWHRGGNTHTGIILLFIPMASSASMSIIRYNDVDVHSFRRYFMEIMKATTVKDAIDACTAIVMSQSENLGRVDNAPDLSSPNFKEKIIEANSTLWDLMEISSRWDIIASELINALELTLTVGYPTFIRVYGETEDINTATVHTFLELLSRVPDTLIARKVGLKYTQEISKAVPIGLKEAERISREARKILELGGLTTDDGTRALKALDQELKAKDLNPGSTADLTAASIFYAMLSGFRF